MARPMTGRYPYVFLTLKQNSIILFRMMAKTCTYVYEPPMMIMYQVLHAGVCKYGSIPQVKKAIRSEFYVLYHRNQSIVRMMVRNIKTIPVQIIQNNKPNSIRVFLILHD